MRTPPVGAPVVERVHLATTAALLLVVVVDPTQVLRRSEDWSGWLQGQQRVDRVMRRIAPPMFLTTGVAALAAAGVALSEHRPRRTAARVGAAGCVLGAIAVTLRVNEPLNSQVRRWSATDPPAPGWRELRGRWDRAHRVRRGVLALGAGLTVVGVVVDR